MNRPLPNIGKKTPFCLKYMSEYMFINLFNVKMAHTLELGAFR